MTDSLSSRKLPLPSFLKALTNNGIPVPKAMAVASKIYKEFNNPESLSHLTDAKLVSSGINDKETRKVTLNAIRKAGYTARLPKANPDTKAASKNTPDQAEGSRVSQSRPAPAMQAVTTPAKRKRKRVEDLNDLLPNGPPDEAASYGSLEFDEVMDEEILKTKSTVVNRAPLMTAWSAIVAERMGFHREEALSIASVYTEMNAISKGVSLGIYNQSKAEGVEAIKDGSQPYVELMGRRIPLYQTQSSQWRALSNSSPALPSTAFSYISRSFRQTTPYIIGSLRLLAESYTPQELNSKGFSLYADFRPAVDGWGKRGEVKCSAILALKSKSKPSVDVSTTKEVIKIQESVGSDCLNIGAEEPGRKKSRGLTLEEYEAILDQDPTFDDFEFT